MSNSHTGKSSDEKNYGAKIGIFSDKMGDVDNICQTLPASAGTCGGVVVVLLWCCCVAVRKKGEFAYGRLVLAVLVRGEVCFRTSAGGQGQVATDARCRRG